MCVSCRLWGISICRGFVACGWPAVVVAKRSYFGGARLLGCVHCRHNVFGWQAAVATADASRRLATRDRNRGVCVCSQSGREFVLRLAVWQQHLAPATHGANAWACVPCLMCWHWHCCVRLCGSTFLTILHHPCLRCVVGCSCATPMVAVFTPPALLCCGFGPCRELRVVLVVPLLEVQKRLAFVGFCQKRERVRLSPGLHFSNALIYITVVESLACMHSSAIA